MANGENYYQVKQEFEAYMQQANISKSGPVKPFERWSHRMMERTYPSGELDNVPNIFNIIQEEKKKGAGLKSSTYPNWTSMGPDVVPFGGGNGRLNFTVFHPDSLNVIYVGAPVGGLWKSTDGGVSFKILNDDLPVIGCSDLAIDPTNPQVMYLATGDRDASDSYSIGVLKSLDGGVTWDTTGLTWDYSISTERGTIGRIEINPQNPNMIIAATSLGIYKSITGGQFWSKKSSIQTNYRDLEFKPGDSSTVYAAGSSFVFRSTDAGETWIAMSSLTGSFGRLEIEVTEDDPEYIYALGSNSSNAGYESLWRSTNSGNTWTMMHSRAGSGLNILGWNSNGSGNGGQGWYDLALAVSPLDKDHVVTGGINVWHSLDGGSSFNPISHWTGTGATYIHADQHDIIFKPGTNEIWAANDGGIFKTDDNGAVWTDLTGTLQITQSYRLGISQNTSGYFLAGNQDNGTIMRQANGNYQQVNGGDGFECIVDYTNDLIIYSSIYYGNISRADNGASFIQIAGQGVNGINESGAWETPYVIDPFQNNVLYAGYKNVWRTSDAGQTWSRRNGASISPGGSNINQLEIAPWNIDMLAVTKSGNLYISEDAGNTFANRSSGLPGQFITSVEFSPFYDPNTFTIYATLSGYSDGNKLYKSTDGAQTWQNISNGLPNIPANCVIIDPNTPNDEQIYVGTDVGVYYKNSSMTEFELYSNGLPNTIVEEMEIMANDGNIVACTYGRGLWQVPLYSSVVGFGEEEIVNAESVEISVYPNPFNDDVNINYEIKEAGPVEISITDLQGRVVFNESKSFLESGVYSLDLGNSFAELKAGMYILKFKVADKESTTKLLKQ